MEVEGDKANKTLEFEIICLIKKLGHGPKLDWKAASRQQKCVPVIPEKSKDYANQKLKSMCVFNAWSFYNMETAKKIC